MTLPHFAGTWRFEVLRKLGAGGMGTVYEALDKESHTRVALKTLRAMTPELLLMLKNEFRALQDVQHPQLVTLGELVEDRGQWFFTMELVEGVDFLSWVRPYGAADRAGERAQATTAELLPHAGIAAPRPDSPQTAEYDEGRVRDAFAQLARGLCALHDAHRIHRDIKPSNVLVTAEGRVVILDFGLVHVASHASRAPNRALMGTAVYMAPELAGSGTIGPESDWYSLGVMFHQALTGRLPFDHGDVLLIKQQIEAVPVEQLVAGVPADLTQLCNDLLRIDPKRRPSGPEVIARLRAAHGSDRGAAPESTVFVGRRRELEVLDNAYLEMRKGNAVTVLAHGDSGFGKTSLLQRFTSGLGREPLVLAGRCYERESVIYKAIDGLMDDLTDYLETLPKKEVESVVPRHVALLVEAFPVLNAVEAIAEASAADSDAMHPQERRKRLMAALRELFRLLARSRPVVLTIDDLQWADPDSLVLLSELTREPEAPPMLLVSTMRTAPANLAPLEEAKQRFAKLDANVQYLPVRKLPLEDARALASALVGTVATPEDGEKVVQSIVNEAQGHPLFIAELARRRHEQQAAASLQLDDALWARASRLDPIARQLLELIAVAGLPISQQVAARAASIDAGEFARLISALRVAKLVRTWGARRSDMVEPYHDRVRASVIAQLDGSVRKQWHNQLAVTLESEAETNPETLALHWQEAGRADKAVAYAAAAADRAAKALAFDRAARLYSWAIELGHADPEQRNRWRIHLGDALSNAGRGPQAAETFLAAATEAGAADVLELKRRAADQYLRSGHVEPGLSVLREVLAAIGMRLPSTPARALWSLVLRRAQLRLRGVRYRARPAADIGADVLMRIETCASVASGLANVDMFAGADFQTRTLLLALAAGDPFQVARALAIEAALVSTEGGGSRVRARTLLTLAEEAGRLTDRPQVPGILALAAGVLAVEVGEWKRGRAACDHAQDLLQRTTGTMWELHAAQFHGLAAMVWLGEVGELDRKVRLLLRDAEERGDLLSVVSVGLVAKWYLQLFRDEPAAARSTIASALEQWSRPGFNLQRFGSVIALTELDLYEGDNPGAYQRIVEQWPAIKSSQLLRAQLALIVALFARARAALATSNGPDRERRLQKASADARRIIAQRMGWSTPLGELVLATVAANRNDRAGALQLLESAVAGLKAADMKIVQHVAERRLGELEGGEAGETRAARADSDLESLGIRNPAHLTRMFAPGFHS